MDSVDLITRETSDGSTLIEFNDGVAMLRDAGERAAFLDYLDSVTIVDVLDRAARRIQHRVRFSSQNAYMHAYGDYEPYIINDTQRILGFHTDDWNQLRAALLVIDDACEVLE